MLLRQTFVLFVFLLPFLLQGQTRNNSFGAHFISNYTTFKSPGNGNVFEYVNSYGAGVNFTHLIGKGFYISTELNYERKGSGYDIQFTDENGNPIDGNDDVAVHLDYMSLPILMKYKFGDKLKFNLHDGLGFHYLVNVKSDFEYELDGISFSFYGDIKDYHRFDQSLIGGLGVEYPLNEKIGIYINSRFNYGLLETSNLIDLRFSGTDENIAFSILGGIQF